MLNVVCVKWGDLYSADYVNKLYDMVTRNLGENVIGKFICFTDDCIDIYPQIEARLLPGNLVGWWNKLYLFKEGLFPKGDRIIYLDLDTVIVGSLDEIFSFDDSFAILEDFYRKGGLQSSIMGWEADSYTDIYKDYEDQEFPNLEGGDQEFIENFFNYLKEIETYQHVKFWQKLYYNCFVSYKVHCKDGIPKNAKVIVFHGNPRPHEVLTGWVPKIWKIGGGSSLEIVVQGNTDNETIKKNIAYSMTTGNQIITKPETAHDLTAIIVGGGSSLGDNLVDLKNFATREDCKVVALNNSWRYLVAKTIPVDIHILLDARAENAAFVPSKYVAESLEFKQYYATQCHEDVIDAAENAILWHANTPEIPDAFLDKDMFWIGSGTTVGIRAIPLLYTLGYRKFRLYGYDSSYSNDGEGHVYKQAINDSDRIIEVEAEGRKFKTTAWMVTQTEEFLEVMAHFTNLGCEFTILGDGLLPYSAKTMLVPLVVGEDRGDIIQYDGIWWPKSCKEARKYSNATIGDIDVILAAVGEKKNVCIQAGGNVGVWPKAFAKEFKTVYTFEPDPTNFRCLNLNVLEDNVIKIQGILGNDYGPVSLIKFVENCGAHYVGTEKGNIPTFRIDDLNLNECDLIQLDIEGFEHIALRRAVYTIERFHPVIVVEDKGLSVKYGTEKGTIESMLIKMKYKVHTRTHRDIIFTYNK